MIKALAKPSAKASATVVVGESASGGGGGGGASAFFTEDWQSNDKTTNWTYAAGAGDSANATLVDVGSGDLEWHHVITSGAGDRLVDAVCKTTLPTSVTADDGAFYFDIPFECTALGQGFLQFWFFMGGSPNFGAQVAGAKDVGFIEFVNTSGSPVLNFTENSAAVPNTILATGVYNVAAKTYRLIVGALSGGVRNIKVIEDPDGAATERINYDWAVPANIGSAFGFYAQTNGGQTRTTKLGTIAGYEGAP